MKKDLYQGIRLLLVNMITLSRVILSGIFGYYILLPHQRLSVITVLFIAICVTDLLDGFLARRLSACTRTGAVFDVAADLFFILTSVTALAAACVFPVWMAAVIVLKFFEFCYTSIQFKKISGDSKATLLFDPLGKTAAISFFLLPYLFILMQYLLPFALAMQIFTGICGIVTLAALLSSAGRIRFVLHSRYSMAK